MSMVGNMAIAVCLLAIALSEAPEREVTRYRLGPLEVSFQHVIVGLLLLTVLPRFRVQGKPYVHIAFGCTGGRHRSVFMAEEVAAALREAGFSPTMLHRNLSSRAADLVEGRG